MLVLISLSNISTNMNVLPFLVQNTYKKCTAFFHLFASTHAVLRTEKITEIIHIRGRLQLPILCQLKCALKSTEHF